MGGECSTYGAKKGEYRVLVGNHLEEPGADGTILNCFFGKWHGGTDWIDLAQDNGELL